MNEQEIIRLIEQKKAEAEHNSEAATKWHAETLLTPAGAEAYAQVSKAATQATLLQSLLDEMEGRPTYSLWRQ